MVRAAKNRGITRIVHFTRIPGLVGILDSSAIKARNQLPEDARLKYVYEANAADRRLDQRWHDYVNLSVTDINPWMFRFSMREHEGATWVILEFGPELLGDPGAVFKRRPEIKRLESGNDLTPPPAPVAGSHSRRTANRRARGNEEAAPKPLDVTTQDVVPTASGWGDRVWVIS